ncbi:maleylpyruvate isomerase family mycothiol-dependent enzyme [Streptomyces sp. MST-110588]|uniref:maleylpyruvate isomerase family mycothiol-dependent enzyme n=1 Tax=Streptomyces sp. MST-110588 TaxID=2833628 RepID=UPI001F5CBE48|nr:maleylpyruvate isomerase family mycothiol-dependent enzyme [Streptomyces sp. MST-110588]UNO38682.1 maleylpyruvate isomerase family mycothiol-dependent enzyme [Streptomyces sp. MST-110588]
MSEDGLGPATPEGHARARTLLAAWVLHACSPTETAAVTTHLRACEQCTAEVRTLASAVAELAGAEPADVGMTGVRPAGPQSAEGQSAEAQSAGAERRNTGAPAGPDSETYRRTAAGSFARRPPVPRELPAYVRPYAAQAATLDAVLRELTPDEWRLETVEGWSVAQLVAHLAATDGLLTEETGGEVTGPVPVVRGEGVAMRTRTYTSWAADVPPGAVHTAWRTQSEALRSALTHDGPGPGHHLLTLGGGGLPLPVADHAVGRAFETWVHTRDIGLRTGHRLPPPTRASLTAIADLGVRLLPLALRARGTPLGDRVLRVELTGPGGGTWLLEDSGPATGRPDAGFTLDTLEFCLLAGGRRTPAHISAHTHLTGDHSLARSALAAAPTFSGP